MEANYLLWRPPERGKGLRFESGRGLQFEVLNTPGIIYIHSNHTEMRHRHMDPILVAQIVGHASPAMIMRVFDHVTPSDAHEALMRSLAADD